MYSTVRLTEIAASERGISLDALESVAALGAATGAVLVMIGLTLPWRRAPGTGAMREA